MKVYNNRKSVPQNTVRSELYMTLRRDARNSSGILAICRNKCYSISGAEAPGALDNGRHWLTEAEPAPVLAG